MGALFRPPPRKGWQTKTATLALSRLCDESGSLLRDKQDEKSFLSSLPHYNPSRDILRGLIGEPPPEDHRIIQMVGTA